jgi:uncharacterized membrane protein (UPF0182 family)
VIPLEDTLLYVEPIYLQAERSPMPALRLVVLATQDRLAYATGFSEALKQLLQGSPPPPTFTASTEAEQPQSSKPSSTQPSDIKALVERANQAFNDYRRLTSEGKLAEAGAKLDDLKGALEQLNRTNLTKGQPK